MTKFICDRCGKEVEHLTREKIPTKKISDRSWSGDYVELCGNCHREFARFESSFFETTMNYKVAMYNIFMGRSADNGNTEKDS